MYFFRFFSKIIILLGIFCLGMIYALVQLPWVDLSVLEHYQPGKPSLLLDDEGKEWARFQLDRQQPVPLGIMPQHLINAFLAAEDHSFFSHHGISWRGIIRSSLVNLQQHRIVQGASTITQQLIKLLYTDGKRTFTRKLKEQFLTLIVEQQFTKEHILETYLNHVCFGSGIYGVEAASQRFWGKSVQHLSLEESATLASIVRCPEFYSPLRSPHNAIKRRNLILSIMARLGSITQEEDAQARINSLTIHQDSQTCCAPHLREMVRIHLEKLLGKHLLYTGGFTIQTTLNRASQQAAQEAFTNTVTMLRDKLSIPLEGALLSLESSTGAIKAIIGGFDFNDSQFNRAFQARRQLGSLFKPLLYAAAINNGATFFDTNIDEPFALENEQHQWWQPQNFNKKFEGIMTLGYALSHSNNIVAIKTLLQNGFESVIQLAKATCLATTIPAYPSLALGCIDTSLVQATAMFNIFANQGIYVKPYYLVWIKDELGKKIWKHQQEKYGILSWSVASQVNCVLGNLMQRMRHRFPTLWPACETIGKTGTTNDARTCWFAGSTPTQTTTVYLGRDDNQPLEHNVLASQTALPLWLSFTKKVPQNQSNFMHDPNLTELIVHERTGKFLASKQHPQAITLLVDKRTTF